MSGLFGREQDKRPIIIVPDRAQPVNVALVTPTSSRIVKPLEDDAGNSDITFGNRSTVNIIPIKIKPPSIAHEPWTSFGSLENRIFIDDFCHEKELTVKAQAATYNGATIKLKAATNIEKADRGHNIKLKEEVKVWFPLFNRVSSALHFRATNNDSRVHYDHGLINWSGHLVNLYGSFGFSRDWNKRNMKVGVAFYEDRAVVDNRLTINNEQTVFSSHRVTGKVENVRFGGVAVFDLTNKSFIKKDIFIGYNDQNVDVSLKAEQPFNRKTNNWNNWREWFSSYVLTTAYTRNLKERYGLEVVANPKSNNAVVSALFEYRHSNKSLTKIKLNSLLNVTFLVKKQMTDTFAFSFGTSLPLSNEKKEFKNKFGVQLDFNI